MILFSLGVNFHREGSAYNGATPAIVPDNNCYKNDQHSSRHGISVKLYTIVKYELFFLHTKKGKNFVFCSRDINIVKNCSRNQYVNRATYLLTAIHIM